MFYIIERQDQLDQLHIGEQMFIQVIPVNDNYHPKLQDISLIYVRDLNLHKGYMLCVNHSESFSLEISAIVDRLLFCTKLYTLDKKALIHQLSTLDPQRIYDISIYNNLYPVQTTNISEYETKVEISFKRKYYNTDYNCLIPISKHYEKWENVYDHIEHLINVMIFDYKPYKFMNHYGPLLFSYIESQGIKLHKESFIKYYSSLSNPKFSISKGKIYTQYNINTTTCRPSNAFNGINFAALNKNTGERKTFIAENDRLVEIDFSAYHPNIISRLVGYEYDKNYNFYEQLAKHFPLATPDTIKESVFQQLYGGIRKEYQDQPFFNQVYEYSMNNWRRFNYGEQVSINEIGKSFNKDNIENPTPQKLLNYLVQNSETLLNIVQFSNVMNILKGKNTKIILYTYDSILIDYDDTENLLDDIKSQLLFNTSVKSGTNYNEIEKM